LVLRWIHSSFSNDNEKAFAEISKVIKVNVSTVSNFITTVIQLMYNRITIEHGPLSININTGVDQSSNTRYTRVV